MSEKSGHQSASPQIPKHIKVLFNDYAADYGEPIYLPIPDPRDPDYHVLPIPFFELNIEAQLFKGKKNANRMQFYPYVGLVSGGVPNAQADFHKGLHLAVFGLPFCLDLYCHFQLLLSHPGVFRGVGDCEKEEVRVAWNNSSGSSQLLYFGPLEKHEMFGPVPRDPERKMAAIRLYHWAMRFVGFHELAHLALGHVHLLQEDSGEARIEDNAQAYASETYTLVRRALEHQADLHAFQRMALTALIDSKRSGARKDDLTIFFFEMMYAIMMIMRMWSRGRPLIIGGGVSAYPHPAVRFIGLREASQAYFRELNIEDTDRNAIDEGIALALCEAALGDVALRCEHPSTEWLDNWDDLRDAFNLINGEYRGLEISDRLSKHAFVDYFDALKFLS